MDTPARIEWLQALRGFAALLVLAVSAHTYLGLQVPGLDAAPRDLGGLEVLFAIGGFVVCRTAARARAAARLGQFAARLLLRIYLGWWPALAVIALANLWVLDRALPEAIDLAGSIVLVADLFPAHWPLVFVAGALVAIASDAWTGRGMPLEPPVYLIAGGLAVLAANVGMSAEVASSATWRAVAFGAMAIGLLVACLALEQSPFRPPRWLVAVGDAWYGLCLLHTTLFAVFHAWIAAARSASVPASAWWTLAELAIPPGVVLLGLAWCRWIEQPLYRAGRRALERTGPLPASSGRRARAHT